MFDNLQYSHSNKMFHHQRLNNNYVSKDDYIKDEEVITTAFVQLDNKINDIDTSINANIIDISTRLNNKISLLESNNIIKLNTTSGTNKNIWNEENNDNNCCNS